MFKVADSPSDICMIATTEILHLKAAEDMRSASETHKKEHENENAQVGGDAGKVV